MEKRRAKDNLMRNGVRYLLYFLAVAITPIVAGWIAPLFSFVGYSQMVLFFKEIFTAIFWVIELCVACSLEKKLRIKELAEGEENSDKTENEGGRVALTEENAQEEPRPLLPIRKVLMLGILVIVCILVISAQIGFNVKLFYENTGSGGYGIVNTLGIIGKNIVKCIWIVWFLKIAQAIGRDLTTLRVQEGQEEKQAWIYWTAQIVLMLLFALYDVWISGMSVGFTLTYLLLFYPSFIAINVLTENSGIKAYFLILLIYLL